MIEELKRKAEAATAALAQAIEVLERIENPVKWEIDHVPEGYDINGAMVIAMTEKAPYYQRPAKEALPALRSALAALKDAQ